jgi:hypothetical protein
MDGIDSGSGSGSGSGPAASTATSTALDGSAPNLLAMRPRRTRTAMPDTVTIDGPVGANAGERYQDMTGMTDTKGSIVDIETMDALSEKVSHVRYRTSQAHTALTTTAVATPAHCALHGMLRAHFCLFVLHFSRTSCSLFSLFPH